VSEVALWFWRHHQMHYDIWDSEEEAAGTAVAMTYDGTASPAGVQFPDGRLIDCDDWLAFAEAEEQRRRAFERRAAEREPRPRRKITAPFGGGQLEIDAGDPSWLGT